MNTVDTGGTSRVRAAAALPSSPASAPIPEPQAGGTYTRDPVTHELTRNHAESGPVSGTAPPPDTAAQE